MKAFVFLKVLFVVTGLEQIGGNVDEKCEHRRCHQCIQTLGCVWCNDKNFPLESRRCFSELSKPIECKSFENPQGTVKTSDLNGQNTNGKIHPQVVELRLRKGEKKNISMQYTDEKNRPLDLYILMDLSCTMFKHKQRVANLSLALSENLRNLTSNLQIGFGSFVEKPLPPFGYLSLVVKNETCEKQPVKYAYGFRNHLKMTNDIEKFKSEVESAEISSNFDFPEGTLDALLQSIVCTEQIGWRTGKGNRKLLVISTDGTYHLAGDGKLVGVVLPHDGKCYVDEKTGMYTHSTILDYPSVSLIRQKIREHDLFVIFAVTEDQQHNYIKLSEALYPFAVTQGIDDDEMSITNVIEKKYRELVNSVSLLSEYKHKDNIDVKFYVKCPGESDFKESNLCFNVGPGENVSFKVEVELKDCPSNLDFWKSNLTVYPQSLNDDGMTINLSMLCGCDCEKENPLEPLDTKSEKCSNNGYLRCGICQCASEEWDGPHCNCSVGDGGVVDKSQCIYPLNGLICNNKGTCDSCGTCKCNATDPDVVIGGKHCECVCQTTPGDQGPCNIKAEDGPHGECDCNECRCFSGFKGPACGCTTRNTTCLDAKSPDKICNDLGSCECGKCECGSPTNYGTYCEIQHARINGSCDVARRETKDCIRCLVFANEEQRDDEERKHICREDCRNVNITFSERIDRSRIPVEEVETICIGTEEDMKNCRSDYIIREKHLHDNVIKLEIESGKVVFAEKCPKPAPLLEIMIGIIVGMVLFGVALLLLWKTITHAQDRREYERFEKAINAASWNTQENPLFKSSTTTVRNPAYVSYQQESDEKM